MVKRLGTEILNFFSVFACSEFEDPLPQEDATIVPARRIGKYFTFIFLR